MTRAGGGGAGCGGGCGGGVEAFAGLDFLGLPVKNARSPPVFSFWGGGTAMGCEGGGVRTGICG